MPDPIASHRRKSSRFYRGLTLLCIASLASSCATGSSDLLDAPNAPERTEARQLDDSSDEAPGSAGIEPETLTATKEPTAAAQPALSDAPWPVGLERPEWPDSLPNPQARPDAVLELFALSIEETLDRGVILYDQEIRHSYVNDGALFERRQSWSGVADLTTGEGSVKYELAEVTGPEDGFPTSPGPFVADPALPGPADIAGFLEHLGEGVDRFYTASTRFDGTGYWSTTVDPAGLLALLRGQYGEIAALDDVALDRTSGATVALQTDAEGRLLWITVDFSLWWHAMLDANGIDYQNDQVFVRLNFEEPGDVATLPVACDDGDLDGATICVDDLALRPSPAVEQLPALIATSRDASELATRTALVDPEGTGDYLLIADAVEALWPNAGSLTIELSAGIHPVAEFISLQADGISGRTFAIVGSPEGPSTIDAQGAVAVRTRDLSLQLDRLTILGEVQTEAGSIQIQDSVLRESLAQGLASSAASVVSLTRSTFFENANDGVWIEDSPVKIVDSSSDMNGGTGIALHGSGTVEILDVTTAANSRAGLLIAGARSGTVKGLTTDQNKGHGAVFEMETSIRVEGSSASENEVSGFVFRSTGPNEVLGSVATSNSMGFMMREEGEVTLRDNEAIDNLEDGFNWAGMVEGISDRNTATGNSDTGFEINDRATPQLTRNVAENNWIGFDMRDDSAPELTENTASFNTLFGYHIAERARPSLNDNEARSNLAVGFIAGFDAVVEMVDNRALENEVHGFQWSGGSRGTAERNVAAGNAGTGFVTTDNSAISMSENVSTRNKNGFLWRDNATGSATENLASDNFIGFYFQGSAAPTLMNNTAVGNGGGFVSVESALPDLVENTATDNPQIGFAWEGNSAGSATDNTVTGSEQDYFVGPEANPALSSNN